MSYFYYLQIDGNPENQIRPHILARDVQKPVNLQFDFQGCQKMQVRVAISQKANEMDLPDTTKIVTKLLINAVTVLLLLGDLPTLDLYCKQSCGNRQVPRRRQMANIINTIITFPCFCNV